MKFFPLFDTIAKFLPFPDHKHYLLTRKGMRMFQPKCFFAGHGKTIRVTAQGGSKDSRGTMMIAACERNGQLVRLVGAISFYGKRKFTTAITVEQVDKLTNGKRWDKIGLFESALSVRGKRNAVWIEALDANGNVIL